MTDEAGEPVPSRDGAPALGPHPRRSRLVVFITALRAALAFSIALVLLVTPERGGSALSGFMGAYWLVSGLFSLAWAVRGPSLRRLALVSGVIGLSAGLIVLGQRWGLVDIVPADLILPMLGVVIGLTGVLHVVGGFMVGERIDRWPAGHLLLGLLELVLACVLLVAPGLPGVIESIAILWALMSGLVLSFDALRAHRRWLSTAPTPHR